jgi:hypothetical protein
MVKISDLLMSCFNFSFVGPISHAESLSLFQVTGSKYAVNLLNRISAGGSYSLLGRTKLELGRIKPTFPDGDIIVTYDNNQVIGRQYGVKWLGSQPISTVTGITVFKDSYQANCQQTYHLHSNLFEMEFSRSKLMDKYNSFYSECNDIHGQYRANFINLRLDDLQKSIILSNGNATDPIEIDDFDSFESSSSHLSYDRVPSDQSTCKIYDQECLPLNPNSELRIIEVLDHIIKMSKESDSTRKWLVLTIKSLHNLLFKVIILIIG